METSMDTKLTPSFKLNLNWLNLSYFFILVILLNSMIVGVTGVIKGLDAAPIRPVILVAMTLTWLLYQFRAKRWVIITLTILIGFVLVLTTIGNLWNEWWELFRWMTYSITRLFRAIFHDLTYPSIGPVIYALEQLLDKFGILLERLWTWIRTLPQPSPDVFSTGLVWSLIMWFTSIWTTWYIIRRNQPLRGALPIIILVGGLRAYTNSSASIMLTTLGATLALMVIISQNRRERNWFEKSVGFSHIIQRNSTWAAILLSVTLVISAEIISSIDFDDLIDRMREPELSETADPEQDNTGRYEQTSEITGVLNEFRNNIAGGLPNSNLIGSGPELSDEVMMIVKLEEVDPETGDYIPVGTEETPYFRSLTYENYSDQGWRANITKVYGYDDSLSLIKTYTSNERLHHLEVDNSENLRGIIHTVGDLATIDTDYYVGWRERDKEGTLVDMFGAWIPGNNYRAFSIAPIYGENELRESEPSYPDWVTERYLQLPDTVPERVLDLARELTFSHSTPYDRAVAIEKYLRTFPYTLDLPHKPAGVDVAEYFLYTVKRGYCDYYATTMVVLARAVGIPARFVSGFIGGTYDEENGHFVVTADQAHSWVEIYFPGHGWIPFEPTAGRPAIDRLDIRDDQPVEELAIDENNPDQIETSKTPSYFTRVLIAIPFTFLLAFIGFMVWLFVDERIMRYQTPVKVFAKLYRRLERMSIKLNMEVIETYTPYEFSEALQERMTSIAETKVFAKFIQSAPKEIKWLVEQSIVAAYSPNPPDQISRYRAIKSWGILRWQFVLAAIIVRYSSIKSSINLSLQKLRRRSISPASDNIR